MLEGVGIKPVNPCMQCEFGKGTTKKCPSPAEFEMTIPLYSGRSMIMNVCYKHLRTYYGLSPDVDNRPSRTGEKFNTEETHFQSWGWSKF
jgi:hypothetical protein